MSGRERYGNWQKYTNPNPIQRFLMHRFMEQAATWIAPLDIHRVLDAGCAEGFVTRFLLERGALPATLSSFAAGSDSSGTRRKGRNWEAGGRPGRGSFRPGKNWPAKISPGQNNSTGALTPFRPETPKVSEFLGLELGRTGENSLGRPTLAPDFPGPLGRFGARRGKRRPFFRAGA